MNMSLRDRGRALVCYGRVRLAFGGVDSRGADRLLDEEGRLSAGSARGEKRYKKRKGEVQESWCMVERRVVRKFWKSNNSMSLTHA